MKITRVEALYLRLPEISARADGTQDTLIVRVHTKVILLDESWIGAGVSAATFNEFVLPYDQKLVAVAHRAGALVDYHNCGRANAVLEPMADTGADVLEPLTPPSLNGDIWLAEAKQRVGDRVALYGGFNERVLVSNDPEDVRREVQRCINEGAAGDIGPIRGVARGGINEYKRLGAILGYEASRVWWEIEPRPHREQYVSTLESGAPLAVYVDEPLDPPDMTLRVGTRPMHLPLKALPPPETLEAELEAHVARLNEMRAIGGSAAEIQQATMLSKRAAMRADLARQLQGQTHRTFELQVFAIGDEIALVAMPGEPFVEIGLRVKQGSPFKHTLFSGYSNVGWAYIPVPEAYPLGGYEVEITPFSPAAAGQIVEQSLTLLHELAGGGGH